MGNSGSTTSSTETDPTKDVDSSDCEKKFVADTTSVRGKNIQDVASNFFSNNFAKRIAAIPSKDSDSTATPPKDADSTATPPEDANPTATSPEDSDSTTTPPEDAVSATTKTTYAYVLQKITDPTTPKDIDPASTEESNISAVGPPVIRTISVSRADSAQIIDERRKSGRV